jgi:hypothetical protein
LKDHNILVSAGVAALVELFDLEVEDTVMFQNVDNYIPVSATKHTKRLECISYVYVTL